MKKQKYNFKSLIMGLAALGFISIFLISCQDDDNLSNSVHQKTMFQGYSDSQIEDELISFLDNLETIRKYPTDALADEVLELEPILWYMEACINYKYGHSIQPELVKIDTSYVNFNVSGTIYKLGDVQVSYDAMVDSIASYFYELKEEENYFLMANISVASQTSQNISLQVISSFSLNGILPNTNDYDWYWGMNLGQCEISFFAQGLIYIAEQDIPEGKEICHYYSYDNMSLGTTSPYLICHYAEITYGIRHYRNGPAETLPNNQNNS